jgi:predicted nucleic acid-binding protein
MFLLVDSNIILDLLTDNPVWCGPSQKILESYSHYTLSINPIIYGELAAGFERIESLDRAIRLFHRLPLSYPAAFLAEKAYLLYKKKGGTKIRPLPDFFIGAHASVLDIPLITRDTHRYAYYFPKLKIITP